MSIGRPTLSDMTLDDLKRTILPAAYRGGDWVVGRKMLLEEYTRRTGNTVYAVSRPGDILLTVIGYVIAPAAERDIP